MTAVPAAIASGSAHSSGAWLLPSRQGMNNMAAGAKRATKAASWLTTRIARPDSASSLK